MNKYKYVLWDIDGTLLDFLEAEKYAIKSLFNKYNIGECTDEMLAVYSKINVKYWQALERGELTKPEVLIGRFHEFFGLYGIDKSIAESFNSDYQSELGECIVFTEGAKEMLERQKGRYTLVAVTNGTKKAQTKKLSLSGLDKLFDYIFISEDVGFEKPSCEYFNRVFAEAHIEDIARAIIIGDSLTSDIKGGELARIDTCWYNPKKKPNDKDVKPTYEIASLFELSEIL